MSQQLTHLDMNENQILNVLLHLLSDANVSTTLDKVGEIGFNTDTGRISVKNPDGVQGTLYVSDTTTNTTSGQEGDKVITKAAFETMMEARFETAALSLFENAGGADATANLPVPGTADKSKLYIVNGSGDFNGQLGEVANDGDFLYSYDVGGTVTYKLVRTDIDSAMLVELEAAVASDETEAGATQSAIHAFVTGLTDTLTTALNGYVASNDAAVAAIAARVTTAEGEIDTLQSELDTAEAAITAVEGDVSTLQSELDTAEAAISTAEAAITAVEGDVSTLQSELDTAEAAISTAEAAITAVEGDVSTLQSELDTAEAAISTAEAAITAVEGDVSTLQSELDTAEAAITVVETIVEEIERTEEFTADTFTTTTHSVTGGTRQVYTKDLGSGKVGTPLYIKDVATGKKLSGETFGHLDQSVGFFVDSDTAPNSGAYKLGVLVKNVAVVVAKSITVVDDIYEDGDPEIGANITGSPTITNIQVRVNGNNWIEHTVGSYSNADGSVDFNDLNELNVYLQSNTKVQYITFGVLSFADGQTVEMKISEDNGSTWINSDAVVLSRS